MITAADKLLLASGTQSNALGTPYLEFVSSTAMTISPKYTNPGVTLQYSLDGTSWTDITSGATTPSANIIYFRGCATGTKSLYVAEATANAWTFTGATNLECKGKLDRLLQNTLGGDDDVLTIGDLCYTFIFYNNTALTTVPALPATTLAASCYNQMFYGCTGLTTAPALPATTLATQCYQSMFYGCTNLTTAPALPAATLASNCYQNMFFSCTGLKLSTTMTGIYDTAYRIPKTGTGTTATSALADMFTGTGGTFAGEPTINTTYYTENTPR